MCADAGYRQFSNQPDQNVPQSSLPIITSASGLFSYENENLFAKFSFFLLGNSAFGYFLRRKNKNFIENLIHFHKRINPKLRLVLSKASLRNFALDGKLVNYPLYSIGLFPRFRFSI